MSDELVYPFKRGRFSCVPCETLFYADQGDIFNSLDGESIVFRALCFSCGEPAPESASMRNLHKTIGTAKGANMSPEAREKVKMNGYRTGVSTGYVKGTDTRIQLPPAKPGKYAECDTCQDLEPCKDSVEDKRGTSIPAYCHRKGEISLKFASAFLSGDPGDLKFIAAQNAANMQMVLNDCIKAIFEKGAQLISQEYKYDAFGKAILLPQSNKDILAGIPGSYDVVEKITAHPLIKRCIEISQAMGFTLGDWSLTPKSKEANPQIEGFLAGLSTGGATAAADLAKNMEKTVLDFKLALDDAKAARAADKTLADFELEESKRDDQGSLE